MAKSLENICKKKLHIDESIPVSEIVNFLEKEKVYNLDSLFIINFKDINPISLNSTSIHKYCDYKILGFIPKRGRYGNYYHIFCKISYNGEKEYKVFISNKKLTSEINKYSFEKLDLGVSTFKKRFQGCCERVETSNLNKKELKNLIKINDFYYKKILERDYIVFYPNDLDFYKGVKYRKIEIL